MNVTVSEMATFSFFYYKDKKYKKELNKVVIFKRMNTTLKHFGAHYVPTKNAHNIEYAIIFYLL